MISNKEWIGDWYFLLRGEPITLFGVLKYEVGQTPELRISSRDNVNAGHDPLGRIFSDDEIKIIRGIEHKTHRPIVLRNSFVKESSISRGTNIIIRVGQIIEDAIFQTENDIVIDEVVVEFSGLGEWMHRRGLKVSGNQDRSDINLNLEYLRPKAFDIVIDENVDMTLWVSPSFGDSDLFSYTISERFFLTIKYKTNGRTIKDVLFMVEKVRRMFSTFYNESCYLKSLKIGQCENEDIINDSKSVKLYEVYYNSNPDGLKDNVRSFDMIVTFDMVETQIDRVIRKWLSYKEEDGIDYVHWIASKSLNFFSEDVFLGYARALEVFHREKSDEKLFEESEKIKIIDDVVNFIKNNIHNVNGKDVSVYNVDDTLLIEKVSDSLRFINELSLRDRLKILFKYILDKVGSEDLKLKFPDRKRLIHKTTENRNYYTHYGSVPKGGVTPIEKLYDITSELRSLLLLLVFDDLGLDIKKLIRRS